MFKFGLMMIWLLTAAVGGLAYSPFIPVLTYHFFSVLRPQFIWSYSLSQFVSNEFPWSMLAALAAIGSSIIWRGAIWLAPNRMRGVRLPSFHAGHAVFGFFGLWITLSYFNSRSKAAAEVCFSDYQKIFLMFFITSIVMITIRQAWLLYLATALALGYIGYEINEIYITSGGYNFIYIQGFCGLDNNGAALLLCMGIPLCVFAWDGIKGRIRWLFPVLALFLIHCVLLSYSRGAMLSSLLAVPFYFLRARNRKMVVVFALIGTAMLPFLAGKEIVARFSSISEHDQDGSANSRKTTWAIAWKMAKENPMLGLGLRNSPLFTFEYGADEQGRVIHSTYLQIAADSGIVGLAGYAMIIVAAVVTARRVRHSIAGTVTTAQLARSLLLFASGKPWHLKKTEGLSGPDADLAYAMACGVEGSLVSFSFGCMFLSLETFEPFYVVAGLGIQLGSIVKLMRDQQKMAVSA